MRVLLLNLSVFLFYVCSKVDLDDPETTKEIEAIAISKSEFDSLPNKESFTGWVKISWNFGKGPLRGLRQYSNGKPDGPCFMWERDGSKSEERYHKDGKRHGSWKAWKDGKLTEDRYYKNGSRVDDE